MEKIGVNDTEFLNRLVSWVQTIRTTYINEGFAEPGTIVRAEIVDVEEARKAAPLEFHLHHPGQTRTALAPVTDENLRHIPSPGQRAKLAGRPEGGNGGPVASG